MALLLHSFQVPPKTAADGAVKELADALVERGHEAIVFGCHRGPWVRSVEEHRDVVRVRHLPETPLRARGFATPVTQIPLTLLALIEERVNVAHAFSTLDAQAALAWRRLTGKPAVFSFAEPPRRENLADRRGQMRLLSRAFQSSDAVTATDAETREAIERWLAVDVEAIEPSNAPAYEKLYKETRVGEGPRPDPGL